MDDEKMMDSIFRFFSSVIMIDLLEVQEAHSLLESINVSKDKVDEAMTFINNNLNEEIKKKAVDEFSKVMEETIKTVEMARAYQEMETLNSSEEELWGVEKSMNLSLNLRWDAEEENEQILERA